MELKVREFKALGVASVIALLCCIPVAFLLGAAPRAPQAPHVPLAPGVHEGQLATMHWRLVDETDDQGRPVARVPLNTTFYKDPDQCANDGEKVAPPEQTHLIRCLPYRGGEDTPDSTPLN